MKRYIFFSLLMSVSICGAGNTENLEAARQELNLARQAYNIAETDSNTPQEKLKQLKAQVDAAEAKADKLK